MRDMEAYHTLRLYDTEFIARLSALMEREQKNYRNKNEFLTAILKNGYEVYIAALRKAGAPNTSAASDKTKTNPPAENNDGIYALLAEMNQCITLQLKIISLYQEIQQKLLSSIYRVMLSLAGGEKIIHTNIEAGFFDDLPTRFEKIVLNLKKEYGLL